MRVLASGLKRFRRRRSLVLTLLLALTGCAPKPVATPVRVDNPHTGLHPTFYANGQPVSQVETTDDGTFQSWRFTATGTLKGDQYTAPKITAEVTLPCGKKQFDIPLESLAWEVITADVKAGHPRELPYDWPLLLPDFNLLPITVDNRDGEAGELKVGEMALPVRAHAMDRVDAYLPTCASVPVTFRGEEVGNTGNQALAANQYAMLFVAPAKRCYNLTELLYIPEADPGYGYKPPKPERLAGKRLYVLPSYATFEPKDVPGTISSQAGAQIYELKDAACR